MKSASPRCDPENWTGTLEMREGALPDVGRWSLDFRSVVGRTFVLRGVEATIEGDVSVVGGRPVLHLARGGLIRLAPLRGKIQWDPDLKRERSPTTAERTAFGRLSDILAMSEAELIPVRIVGVLGASALRGGPQALGVRDFRTVP